MYNFVHQDFFAIRAGNTKKAIHVKMKPSLKRFYSEKKKDMKDTGGQAGKK